MKTPQDPEAAETVQTTENQAVAQERLMITPEKLNKMDQCRHLLDAPAPQVVGELIDEIRRQCEALTCFVRMLVVGLTPAGSEIVMA